MLKKIFATMLLAVTLVLLGGQSNQAEARYIVTGIRTYLSIRSAPSVYSRELARIPNGTILYDEGDYRNGFSYISYNGLYGWVSDTYIRWIN